jgi:hypothetical protein
MLDSFACDHTIKSKSTSALVIVCSCRFVRHYYYYYVHLGRTYYISTDFFHAKLVRHNHEDSHRRHICNC